MILNIKSPILEEIIEKQLVWEFFGRRRDGFFVEVGANDPHSGSQTWLLEQNGWRGVLVEPQAVLSEKLRSERKNSKVFQVACSRPEKEGEGSLHIGAHSGISTLEQQTDSHGAQFIGTERVKITTLDKVLSEAGATTIDFLSLDVEGHEIEVMHGFDFEKYHPSLILIEDGVRTLDKHRFLRRKGYRLVKRTTLNNWYIPQGQASPGIFWLERLELFRKMFLGLPFRKVRLFLRRRAKGSGGTTGQ
ncbi:MAG TPA: FkbM family methyltransferase [Candidatus Sulfopaludibacter sp.]|nr:FkbM family methyltransferase [Candidatus Sulfopaludibacter sp.]